MDADTKALGDSGCGSASAQAKTISARTPIGRSFTLPDSANEFVLFPFGRDHRCSGRPVFVEAVSWPSSGGESTPNDKEAVISTCLIFFCYKYFDWSGRWNIKWEQYLKI